MFNEEKLFTIGEFASKAGITLRTLRYYDKIGLLKPCAHKESGHRLYSRQDFARLQKILTLKFIGMSLEDISNIVKNDTNDNSFKNSLEIQGKIIDEKIHHMTMVKSAINEALHMTNENEAVNWDKFVNIINVLNMDKKWSIQYQNASNLRARIRIHELFSINKYGWMEWFFDQLSLPQNAKILEIGCGDASLWIKNYKKIPLSWDITLTDFSEGMLKDAQINLANYKSRFKLKLVDVRDIPYEDSSFDAVIANNMLYHVDNKEQAFSEIHRVLKDGGHFYASTVGKKHMAELRQIAEKLGTEMSESDNKNYTESFQLENGFTIVSKWFKEVIIKRYEDNLIITDAEALMDYLFSIPENFREKINDSKLKVFEQSLKEEIKKLNGIFITKDTGFFYGVKK
ncbi:MAG: methyltransferase domain-containing protein [Bacillota bacterium]|nr:methyltransferase domain-containing protein [Bacillota bacterium]